MKNCSKKFLIKTNKRERKILNTVVAVFAITATDGIPSLKTKNATLFSIAFLFDKSITISICKYPIYMDLR